MKYKELKSIYYAENDKYAQAYSERFHSEESVKLDFQVGSNQAFFLQNAQVMTLAYKIAKMDKEIEILCSKLPGVALEQYTKKCLIDEIVLTNKIEGVHSSRKEIGEVLDTLEMQSKATGKHIRFNGLVNKYLMLVKSKDICLNSCKDIRDLYDEVFLDEVVFEDPQNKPDGELFRKQAVSVHSETDKVIHNGVMPESKIIEAMEKGLKFLHDDSVEELFRVCLFHYLIEYIHPFYDGNGRLGRLIFSYGITKTLCPLIAFRISETIKVKISAYYKAFAACNDQRNLGDLTPFLIMQLSMIYDAAKDLRESLIERMQIWKKYEAAILKHSDESEDVRLLYSYLIQAALFSEKGISMIELTSNMHCSKYTIDKLMKEIEPEKIVTKKKGNTRFYSINLETLHNEIVTAGIEKQ